MQQGSRDHPELLFGLLYLISLEKKVSINSYRGALAITSSSKLGLLVGSVFPCGTPSVVLTASWIAKPTRPLPWRTWGGGYPSDAWLVGDSRAVSSSTVSISPHFSLVMLTSPVSPSVLPSDHNFFLIVSLLIVNSFIFIFYIFPIMSYLLLKLPCVMYSKRNASLYEMPSACKHPISLKTSSNDLWKYPHHFTESLSLVYSDVKLLVSRLGADTLICVQSPTVHMGHFSINNSTGFICCIL